jgi:hypothetical protein
MAINRELNWQGQQRVDIPHLRMVESAARYDFDALAYSLCGDKPYILKGFEVVGTPVQNSVSTLTIRTAGSRMFHHLATDSGSMFAVPTDRALEVLDISKNSRIIGGWTSGTTNYLGIDLIKSADSDTEDSIKLLDSATKNEASQRTPLARTLDYKFVITTLDFSYNKNICPLAIVVIDSRGVVQTCTDARPLWGRLSTGGSNTIDYQPYGWPGGRVSVEDPTNTASGDKSLTSMKAWMNGVMSRIWEIGGGQYWYSPTADRNVMMAYGGTTFTSTGEAFEVVSNNVHWKGISFLFDNTPESVATVNDQLTDLAGLTDLADGECIYVDLNRASASALQPQKGELMTLGISSRPGQRHVICTRLGSNFYVKGTPWPIGSMSNAISTTLVTGRIRTTINANGADTTNPFAVGLANSITGAYSATCGGISHNIGLGTTKLAAGPIIVGGGGGDEDIGLLPGFGSRVVVTAETVGGVASFYQSSEATPDTTKIVKFGTLLTDQIVDRTTGAVEDNSEAVVTVESNGAIGFANTDSVFNRTFNSYPSIPTAPDTDAFGLIRSKLFVRSDKVWMEPVAAVFNNNGNFFGGWTNTSPNVWTQTATTALAASQFYGVTPTLGMRVLVWFGFGIGGGDTGTPTAQNQWIYTITNMGGGGNNATLTRATDTDTTAKVFDGVAVYNSSAGDLGGRYFKMITPTPLIINVTPLHIVLTDNQTRDELRMMWHNGSVTTICQGPFYDYLIPS